jgi:tetratricopeptide repeat protein 30
MERKLGLIVDKYVAVLTNQAKIYWDLKDYKSVEELFTESDDICTEHKIFQVNIAHSIYMQDQKQVESISHYEKLVDSHSDNLLNCETIVLANLCVCYILTKQNAKAEALIQKIEQHE